MYVSLKQSIAYLKTFEKIFEDKNKTSAPMWSDVQIDTYHMIPMT